MGLTYSSVVSAAPDEVFAWHSRPGAITRLMPPWQPVRVTSEASSVRDGQAVLALPGGLRWVAGHDPDSYDPPRQFADVLLPPLGAALPWRHTHTFAPAPDGGTTIVDAVCTPVPARALRPMFGYRHRQFAADLAAHARARQACPQALTVALTGASGLVGSALAALLTSGGHRVIRLVRRAPRDDGEREWRPADPDPRLLDGADAVIHLAGAPIGGRFTPERKREILSSRAGPTRALATLAASAPSRLRAFVTASAVGFYGADRGDETLTETSGRGEGFLADVTAAWEDATSPALAAGIRTVQVRTGIVQTPRGGMLRLLYPLFEAAGRSARRRHRVAALDRDRRPAGHLPARGHRPGARRAGQRGRAGTGAQRRVRAHAGPGAPQACADPGPPGRTAAAARRRGSRRARGRQPAGSPGGTGRRRSPVPVPRPGGRASARPGPRAGGRQRGRLCLSASASGNGARYVCSASQGSSPSLA